MFSKELIPVSYLLENKTPVLIFIWNELWLRLDCRTEELRLDMRQTAVILFWTYFYQFDQYILLVVDFEWEKNPNHLWDVVIESI